jgi:DNA-binding transcriptional LysR family regulator
MLAGVEAATAVAAEARVEPQGMIRLSCPQGLIQGLFAEVLPGFLLAYPNVRVQVRMFNRPVDLIDDGVDVAIRARTRLDPDSNLIMRSLARSWLVLAMSPALLRSAGDTLQVQDLANLPTLSMEDAEDAVWELVGPSDETVTIRHQPRLLCGNFDVLRQAAIDGVGVALLPQHICQTSFDSGELIHALPGWHTQYGLIHAVYLTRKGLLPAVRALIDYLALEFPKRLQGA